MFDINDLIEQCRQAIVESDPRLAVHDVLQRAVGRPDEVAAALPATRAEIVPLYVAEDLTVLKVVWAPGMRIWPHNHLMWADIALYGGQEDNSFFRRTPDGIEAVGGRQLRTGDVAALGPETIHAVANPRRTFTGAIHVDGGDITSPVAASGTSTRSTRCPTTSSGRSRSSPMPTPSSGVSHRHRHCRRCRPRR